MDGNTLNTTRKLPTNRRNWVYAVACMCSLFIWADEFTFSSTMPYWQESFGFSAAQAATISSMYVVTYACSQIYGGFLGDKFGAKKILLVCIGGVGVCCLSILFCEGYTSMCARNLIFGAFFGLFWGPCEKLMTTWLPNNERGTKASVWGTLCTASQLYATPLALFIASTFHWKLSFVVVTCLMVPLFFFVISIKNSPSEDKRVSPEELAYINQGRADEKEMEEKATFGELIRMLRHPWIILGIFAVLLTNMSTWMSATWISKILLQGYKVDPTIASFMIAPMALIPVLAGLFVGPLLKKVFRGNINMLFIVGSVVGTIAYISPTFIDYGPLAFTLVIVGFGVIGNSFGFGGGNLWFNTMAPPKYQGTLNGIAVGMQGLIGSVFVNLSGRWVTDEYAFDGYNKIFLYLGLIWILGIITGIILKTRHVDDVYTDGGYLD